ncbi:LGFP repeat-containing protein [Nocardia nova]|uniref:LGFP repeat-containing protein n=1 Tax=Nocardia nova TaxID=37330 RepID=UPI00215885CF|nr:hypothetical protein [Nocardia nova]
MVVDVSDRFAGPLPDHCRELGYPTSDEKGNPAGKESDFTGGTITWNSADRQTTATTK